MRTEGGCTHRQNLPTEPKFHLSTSCGSSFINVMKYLNFRKMSFINDSISTRKFIKKTKIEKTFYLNVYSQISPNILSKTVIGTPKSLKI